MIMASLSKAREYFNSGLYEKSLREYEIYAKSNNPNKINVEFNISLCKSRIGDGNLTQHLDDNPSNIEANEYSILSCDISKHFETHKVNQDDLLAFYRKIKDNKIQNIQLHEMAKILLYSPFQINLLLLCGYIIAKNNQLSILSNFQHSHISLLDLIRSTIDYKYWLDNKSRILSLMSDLQVAKDGKFLGDDFRSFDKKDILNLDIILKQIKHLPTNSNQTQMVELTIGSILLNEAKFIGLNLINHYNVCDEWVLIEGACQGYPTRKVTHDGLSLDNSAIQIMLFPDRYNKIRFIQHGWTNSTGEDAKSELRNQYLKYAKGNVLLVLDIDEFYSESDIKFVLNKFNKDKSLTAFTLPQVHFWKGIDRFITGGYYDISHTRFFRNIFGMKYISNHNFPEIGGVLLNKMAHKKEPRTIKEIKPGHFKYEGPRCYHMGFSKDEDDMRDKTDYYVNRGEATTRKNTTDSRAGWFTGELPAECLVRTWGGNTPRVLQMCNS